MPVAYVPAEQTPHVERPAMPCAYPAGQASHAVAVPLRPGMHDVQRVAPWATAYVAEVVPVNVHWPSGHAAHTDMPAAAAMVPAAHVAHVAAVVAPVAADAVPGVHLSHIVPV